MKKILLFAALLLWAVQGLAAPVDQASAQGAAQSFLSEKTGSARLAATQPRLMWVHTQSVKANPALAAYYVVNTDQGFVIVAGDDRCQEILAWGDAPLDGMNVLPANMKFWLSQYEHQMEYLLVNPGIKVSAPVRSGQTVLPCLTSTAKTAGMAPTRVTPVVPPRRWRWCFTTGSILVSRRLPFRHTCHRSMAS